MTRHPRIQIGHRFLAVTTMRDDRNLTGRRIDLDARDINARCSRGS
jgi:hypothetical protein